MNVIQKYILVHKLSRAMFGRMCGVDPTTVYYWCIGHSKPSPRNVRRIENATKGKIKVSQLGCKKVGCKIKKIKIEKECA